MNTSQANSYENADLGSSDQNKKFLKLMGGGKKEKSSETLPQNEAKESAVCNVTDEEQAKNEELIDVKSANAWEKASFDDNSRKNKFLRLMGASKKEHTGKFVIGDATEGNERLKFQKRNDLEEKLENQYKQGLELKMTGAARRHKGLGFNDPPPEEKKESSNQDENSGEQSSSRQEEPSVEREHSQGNDRRNENRDRDRYNRQYRGDRRDHHHTEQSYRDRSRDRSHWNQYTENKYSSKGGDNYNPNYNYSSNPNFRNERRDYGNDYSYNQDQQAQQPSHTGGYGNNYNIPPPPPQSTTSGTHENQQYQHYAHTAPNMPQQQHQFYSQTPHSSYGNTQQNIQPVQNYGAPPNYVQQQQQYHQTHNSGYDYAAQPPTSQYYQDADNVQSFHTQIPQSQSKKGMINFVKSSNS